MPTLNKYFEILDIGPNTPYDEAKAAYRDLASILHPDKHMHNERLRIRATEKFKQLQNAWSELESHYKYAEQQLKEQEKHEKQNKEREARQKENAEREKTEREEQEERDYVKHVCVNCGSVNRVLRAKSFESAKCGVCKKYLSLERQMEAQAKAEERKKVRAEKDRRRREAARAKAAEEAKVSAEAKAEAEKRLAASIITRICPNCGNVNKVWPYMEARAICIKCKYSISLSAIEWRNKKEGSWKRFKLVLAFYAVIYVLIMCTSGGLGVLITIGTAPFLVGFTYFICCYLFL
jgi:curved DNA-binding protein CbpA